MSIPSKLTKLSYKSLFIVVAFLLIPIIMMVRLQEPNPAAAGWFNDSWMYRKAIGVTGASSDLTDFQISFDIGTSDLVNSGKIQSDCDDLRVTDHNGKLLPHWIEENNPGCNAATDTKVWVKVPSIPSSDATIYVYYGNPSARNVENGDNVFEFFDDFNLDTSSDYTITEQVNRGAGTGFVWDTTNSELESDTSNDCVTIHTPTSLSTFYVWTTAAYTGDDDGVGVLIKSSSTFYEAIITSNHPAEGDGIYTRTSGEPSLAQATTNPHTSQAQTHEIGLSYDGSQLKMYVDGILEATYNASITPTGLGVISEANGPAATYSNLIARKYTPIQPSSTLASEEVSPGPIAFWKFDEGVGTTAYDSTQNNNDGKISGATWQNEDMCVSGKCFYFDGSSDKISMADSTVLDISSPLTVSAWIKPNTVSGSQIIVDKEPGGIGGTEDGYQFYLDDSNLKVCYGDGGSEECVTANSAIEANVWQSVSLVFDNSNVTLYKNGIVIKRDTSQIATSFSNSDILEIGEHTCSGCKNTFTGFIDQVKIYPYARTAEEIKANYNSGKAGLSSDKGSSTILGTSSGGNNLSSGLVGYWNMDAGTGTTIVDLSGNGNTGTLINAGWITGKFGIGTSFDGNNDYINIPTNPISTNTISFGGWFKVPDSSNDYTLMSGNESNAVNEFTLQSDNSSGLALIHYDDSGGNHNIPSSQYITNEWVHLFGTYDGNTIKFYINGNFINSNTNITSRPQDVSPWTIGRREASGGSDYQKGPIDEIRIYNRALSPTEVRQLYNWAPGPVAYYNFDEGSGDTANDTSGNSNTGTWSGTGTHWGVGKYGNAGNFNGSDDYVNIASGPTLGTNDFAFMAWVKYEDINGGGGNPQSVIANETYACKGPSITEDYGTIKFYTAVSGKSFGGSNISTILNQYTHIAFIRQGDTVYGYENGILKGSVTDSEIGTMDVSNNTWKIGYHGSCTGGVTPLKGLIDEVKIYNYARTPGQIVEDMNAGHPIGGSPVGSQAGYWNFEKGYGSTTYDKSGQGNNGTLGTGNSAPSWTNNGKIGKALSFDGNDYTKVGTNLNPPTAITISAWANTQLVSGSYYSIVGRYYNDSPWYSYELFYDYGVLKFKINLDGVGKNVSTTPPSTDTWHHITGTYDGTNIKIYLDGKLKNSTSASGDIFYTPGWDTYIGARVYNSDFFYGSIDEVKIYNSALTADQVKFDYNQGKAAILGASSSNTGSTAPAGSASQEYCVPGSTDACTPPVAEWNFEENTGSSANDTSGNGNTATLGSGNSAPTWDVGYNSSGAGLKFDGSNDYANAGTNPITGTNAFTIQGWFKTGSHSDYGLGLLIGNASSSQSAWLGWSQAVQVGTPNSIGGGFYGSNYGSGITDNNWHFLTLTFSGGASGTALLYADGIQKTTDTETPNLQSTSIMFGKANTGTDHWYNGLVDQVRIYDYARTPAQIAWDYNRGKPIAHWRLDECQGTIISNAISIGNTGNLNIGPSGSQTSAGTCATASTAWGVGSTGKYSASLNFDGTDDYVSIGDIGTSATALSFWVKPSSTTQSIVELSASDSIAISSSTVSVTGFGTETVYVDGHISSSVSNTNWHHITVVSSASIPANTVNIGKVSSTYYSGQIDDVKVFNYALTSDQIKVLYNDGAVSFK